MINDKIKIRVSNFVINVIENDCMEFNFIKKDNLPNKNDFINKLIPNLLDLRKQRRQKIKDTLSQDLYRENAEDIYNVVNYLIDQVYFLDIELEKLDCEIWIRPQKNYMEYFDEIENSETKITCMDVTSYIRGLLNEYVRFPKYKRISILFRKELNIVDTADQSKRLLNFRYNNEKYKICVYNYYYGYITDQNTYIIGYDVNKKQIMSFLIQNMENLYIVQQKFYIDESLESIFEDYVKSYEYTKNIVIQIKESGDE